MKHKFYNFFSAFFKRRPVSGYSQRNVINKKSGSPFALVNYKLPLPAEYGLSGKKLLFFSDIHFGVSHLDSSVLKNMIAETAPDWIVFGGDLITYACHQNDAFDFLREITSLVPGAAKIAVYGNWDRRRCQWYPNSRWKDAFGSIGFNLLINENIVLKGINFFGMDEPRNGYPLLRDEFLKKNMLNCVVSHNIDSVIDSGFVLPPETLILAGHSHAGQIRVPLFGALFTSSKYWKTFEYGHYRLSEGGNLIVTSGIGTSRWPVRLFCDPELVVIEF